MYNTDIQRNYGNTLYMCVSILLDNDFENLLSLVNTWQSGNVAVVPQARCGEINGAK